MPLFRSSRRTGPAFMLQNGPVLSPRIRPKSQKKSHPQSLETPQLGFLWNFPGLSCHSRGPLRPAPCLRSTSDLGAAARGWVRRGSPKRLRADARRCRAVRASGRANVALALARRRTQVRGRALAPP